jgi:hypothetical protein
VPSALGHGSPRGTRLPHQTNGPHGAAQVREVSNLQGYHGDCLTRVDPRPYRVAAARQADGAAEAPRRRKPVYTEKVKFESIGSVIRQGSNAI